MSCRAVYYKKKDSVAQAHDAMATTSVLASIERYLQPRVVGSLSDANAELIVQAMAAHFADIFPIGSMGFVYFPTITIKINHSCR